MFILSVISFLISLVLILFALCRYIFLVLSPANIIKKNTVSIWTDCIQCIHLAPFTGFFYLYLILLCLLLFTFSHPIFSVFITLTGNFNRYFSKCIQHCFVSAIDFSILYWISKKYFAGVFVQKTSTRT